MNRPSRSWEAARSYLFLSTTAHFSLHPLLFQPREWPIKHVLVVAHAVGFAAAARCLLPSRAGAEGRSARRPQLLSFWQAGYLLGLGALELLCTFVLPAVSARRFPFLKLWLTSLYCAAGILFCWAKEALFWARLAAAPSGK